MSKISLSDALRGQLQSCFGEALMVVWYDAGGTFEPILSQCIPDGVEVIRYTGSYLSIRFKIEHDRTFTKKCLIYIPTSPLEPSWLRDYEMFGERLLLDLPNMLWDTFHVKRTPEIQSILTPTNCRQLARKWDSVLGHVRVPLDLRELEEAMLAGVLGYDSKFDIEEVVLQLLAFPEEVQHHLEAALLENLFSEIVASYGFPRESASEPNQLAAAILLTELAENSKDLDLSDLTAILPEGLDRKRWARVAKKWASNVAYRDAFLKWSTVVEKQYSVLERVRGHDGIADIESFQAIDVALLQNIRERVEGTGYDNLLRHSDYISKIAEKRLEKFWSREKHIKDWIALGKALEVLSRIRANRPALDRTAGASRYIQAYFDELWQIDSAYCEFSSATRELSGTFIASMQEQVDSQYQLWLDDSNAAFTRSVSEYKRWPVEGVVFQQNLWDRIIQKRPKTCLFLIDALRFDLQSKMAEHLKALGHKVEHVRVISSLPTITEVCMSALLPHSKGLTIDYQGGSVALKVDGKTVAGKNDREEVIKKAWKGQAKFIDIDDFIRAAEKECEAIRDADLLVVWSTEIDALGKDLSTEVLDFFDSMLQRTVSAVEKASALGYTRVVIATDHGFLLIPEPDRVEVLDSLSDAGVVSGRRYALGIPPKLDKTFVLLLRNVGYDSDGEVLLPHSIRFLSHSGPKKLFVHGGMSLQECCIGALVLEPRQMADRVNVSIRMPERITTGVVKVELLPTSSMLQPTPRRVRMEAFAEGKCFKSTGPFEIMSEDRVEWLRVPPGCRSIAVRVLDADTLEILDEKTAQIVLEGYDDKL